ncbi:MAG: IPT/TIG domain-containing protein [bacterium]
MQKSKIKIYFIFACVAIAMLAFSHFASAAAGSDVGLEPAAGIGLANSDPRIIAANIIRMILGFLGIAAVCLIIYAGWLYMTAEGEEEKVEKAKKILIGASIGMAICLASFAIASFVLNRLMDASGAETGISDDSGAGTIYSGGGISGLPEEGQPCLKDSLDVQCAAGICDAGLNCSSASCLCEKTDKPAEGQKCDGDANLAGCQAVDCADNLVCSSGDDCSCARTPLIAWISPVSDGAPVGTAGNFITIGGRYFGTSTGQVIFMGDPNKPDDDKIALFPNQVNPLCDSFWQDNQIIAVAPVGAVAGPIKVVDSENYYDTTDNARGALIKDFAIDNIKRPGICKADPAIGGLSDKFNLQGNSFDSAEHSVLFGGSAGSVAADNITGWSKTSVNASVPNIKDGRNSVFVRADNINSNDLVFTVANLSDANPAIEYIDPAQGPVGQYITIYGRNFKSYSAQKSSVKFYLPADPNSKINADIDFPDACRDNWWHANYITVKVPKVNNFSEYKVEVSNSDGKISSPADFIINNKSLSPGICSLNPDNGPVGWPVSANGEKFGSGQGSGRVQYFNNKDGSVRGWNDKKIDSNVPAGAVSGPFKIIDGDGILSNSLPFRVGKCSANSECLSGEECCGAGSYWSGICRAAGSCSQGSPTACGFGWTFSTKSGQCSANQEKCDIPSAVPGSDITFHCCARGQCNKITGQCDGCAANKPDQCDGDLQCCSSGGCKDSDSDGKTECSDGESCSGRGLNQCSSGYFCPNSPGKCSTYGGGSVVETGNCDYGCNNFNACKTDLCEYKSSINRCAEKNHVCALPKIINGSAAAECLPYSGKDRWIIKTLSSCPSGWTNIGSGRCVENNTFCSACSAGFKCVKETDSAIAGVCSIDQSVCPVGSICGSDDKCVKKDSAACECCCRIGHDSEDCCSPLKCEGKCGSDITANTNTYGSCSGCGSVGTTQEEHNKACNCSGTSGKFCLIDSANPAGACKDCSQISDASICGTQGAGVCCVDAKNKNACVGGSAPYAKASPDYNYCAYYECASGSCSDSAVASSSAKSYKTLAECDNKCVQSAQFGNTCFNNVDSNKNCEINKCVGFSCINEDGSGASARKCGTCCCDPYAEQDSCKNINQFLSCKPNQAPCSGEKRGLCCGCGKDSECGDANIVGCGQDACCKARPSVVETAPRDAAEAVCRNGLISAVFDQPMQTSSFKDNIIVAGEYGLEQCPAETQYLTESYKVSLFGRLAKFISRLPLLNKILTKQASALSGNFCAVQGSVSGYAAGKTTALEFKPNSALDANRKYYVIIKSGALSNDGIGLKSMDEKTFNGTSFNGKIWSFTTKSEICLIDYVGISPKSYLFNTSVNNADDDNAAESDYDTIADSDKIFRSTAYSSDKQPIFQIENVYNWRWDWIIDDKSVVKFKNGENALDDSRSQTFAAQNVKEAHTLAHARATVTQDSANKSAIGLSKENTAEIYVFLCANPWPWFKDDGSWEPWRDAPGNCSAAAGNCSNANFEVYYCRDAGKFGTVDDLPAILSDSAVIRGSSAEQNILKEFYFFRESLPDVGGVNLATTTNDIIKQGNRAGLTWRSAVLPSGQVLDKYSVYYGSRAGSYEQSVSTASPGTAAAPFIVSDLTNGVKYYFAVTAKYKSGSESAYSNETSFIPADDWAPQTPQNLTGSSIEGKAAISWQANQDDAAIYKIYYGAESGSAGASASLDKSKCSPTTGKCDIEISGLTAGTNYYFSASALDIQANESKKSKEIIIQIK